MYHRNEEQIRNLENQLERDAKEAEVQMSKTRSKFKAAMAIAVLVALFGVGAERYCNHKSEKISEPYSIEERHKKGVCQELGYLGFVTFLAGLSGLTGSIITYPRKIKYRDINTAT